MPRSKPMCKFQILMNSEGNRFGAGLWTVNVRGQGVFPGLRSDDVERLGEFPVIFAKECLKQGELEGLAEDLDAAEALTSMVNRS